VSELICSKQLEFISSQLNGLSNLKVLFFVESLTYRTYVLRTFKEFPSPNTAVLVGYLVYLGSIVPTVKWDNKSSIVVFFSLWNQSRIESQNVGILAIYFFDIFPGGFRLQSVNTSQWILFGTISIVGRNLLVKCLPRGLL